MGLLGLTRSRYRQDERSSHVWFIAVLSSVSLSPGVLRFWWLEAFREPAYW